MKIEDWGLFLGVREMAATAKPLGTAASREAKGRWEIRYMWWSCGQLTQGGAFGCVEIGGGGSCV